jgi:hypothetical protein
MVGLDPLTALPALFIVWSCALRFYGHLHRYVAGIDGEFFDAAK